MSTDPTALSELLQHIGLSVPTALPQFRVLASFQIRSKMFSPQQSGFVCFCSPLLLNFSNDVRVYVAGTSKTTVLLNKPLA